ncbi:MAG: GNAT family N-acetyltransferase [Povalibacter sp.]
MILQTSRLVLCKLTIEDAAFMVRLLNDPSFIKNIGDKGVRTVADAERWLRDSHLASYQKHGFGHYRVELKSTGVAIGMCGLIKREALGEIDVGFALLPEYCSQGYATEAASAVMEYGRRELGIQRIVGFVSPGNQGSIRVLEKLGLRFAGPSRLSADDEVHLYA